MIDCPVVSPDLPDKRNTKTEAWKVCGRCNGQPEDIIVFATKSLCHACWEILGEKKSLWG